MATGLEEAIQRKRQDELKAFWSADSGDEGDNAGLVDQAAQDAADARVAVDAQAAEAEVSKQLAESEATAAKSDTTDSSAVEIPKHVEAEYGNWKDWPSVEAPPSMAPGLGTIGGMPAGADSLAKPADIQTDLETGTRYVQDPTLGKIPRAELATEADKAAQPAGAPLAQVDVSGNIPVRRGELVGTGPDARAYMIPPADVQPVPDTLPQVEKALPDRIAAPDQLTQVERGQRVGLPAPATLPQVEPGQLVSTPQGAAPRAIGRAALIPTPPKVQPAELVSTPAATQGVSALPTAERFQLDGSPYPDRVQATGDNDPSAFIVHHTSGRGSVDGVVSTLKERGLGVQYVMDRDGKIYQTGGPGAQNIKAGWGEKGTGLNNSNVVGMEIIAKDDKDVTPVQAQAFAQFIAAKYPNTPLYGHGEVNPGHKEADEGLTAKAAAEAYRAGQPPAGPPKQEWESWATTEGPTAAPTAATAAPQHGFYPDENPDQWVIGRATSFGGPDDVAKFAAAKAAGLSDKEAQSVGDEGIGSPWLGKLSTNNTVLNGVAIPKEALQNAFGNDYSAMRRARVDVVDTATGQRMRVPIVDVGPRDTSKARGVATDMTTSLFNAFGGDHGHKFALNIVPDAGSDVIKNPQDFWNEQAAIRQHGDVGAIARKGAQPKAEAWASWQTLSPAEQTSAETAQQFQAQGQRDTLSTLADQTPNLPALIKRLDETVEGVPEATRRDFQNQIKAEATKYAQDYYGEKDPKKAYDLITKGVGPVELAGEVISKVIPNFGKADVAISSFMDSADEKRVKQFFDTVEPNATTEAKAQEIQRLRDTPQEMRGPVINAMIAHTDETTAKAIGEPGNILDSLNRIADPKYQAARTAAIAEKQAWVDRSLRTDPRISGTPAEFVTQQLAALPKNVFESLLPPGARETAFYAEIYTDAKRQAKIDNPKMSEAELDKQATSSAIVQMVPQEVLSAAMGGKLGAITAGVTNPAKRIALSALTHTAVGAAAGGGQQALANVVAGKPALEGVPEAAAGGAIQTLPGGLAAGIHGRPAGIAPPAAERPILGPPEAPSARAEPLTRASVLGPDVPDTSVPWYKPGPIVSRATERGAFTPSQLAEATLRAQTAGSPEQIQRAMEDLRPPEDFNQRTARFQDQPIPENIPIPTQTREDVARRTYENAQERVKANIPGTSLDDYTKAQRDLYNNKETAPITAGTSEPWVSAIANRFTAERAARGDLGEVIPGEGYSKEELRMVGLRMKPEEVNQHVSDLMHNTGNPKLQAAAITAEEARLSQRSNAASRAAEANPSDQALRTEASNAFNDLTDFHNGPVAKLKNNWHAQGMTLQGEVPVDLSTYNGLREDFLRKNGEAPPANLEPAMRKIAKAVADSSAEEKASIQRLGQEIERQTINRRIPTDIEVRDAIMKRMGVEPCRT